MTERTIVSSEIILKLPRHAKLRFDKARDKWIILAPERVFELDEIAYEVISRCDGERTVTDVVNELCLKFDQVEREVIMNDVVGMLQNLADKGFVVS
ncbi:MAG: pyrroloquinoline quinone biosynthesis peptide chaperone PqqD [Rhodospirillaceae bacterium]|nr:pyrroloquinoline quinone biosynthesis peptide chaperone PqqD [Rhodospirillaceae bacterium]|tara:strand:+ start:1035 stop:1325 length:291 start_codon:yes stop_codon:yes gene_type:complete